jgi:RNA polymerase sigma-70 factor (ECF subfamily)
MRDVIIARGLHIDGVMSPSSPSGRERFEALFAAHYRDVHRFALRRTAPAAAEEVANETFLICWRRIGSVPDPALPWLYATAGKCLANQRRAEARHARRERAAADDERSAASGRDPAERFAERDAVLRAFSALGERDREALRLVAWEGLSVADAARAAGLTRAGFAMRLHRARRRLAARLKAADRGFLINPHLENADDLAC